MANIFEGKTTNEAIEKGLKELKLSRKQVDVKVLESDDKRSFFSILTPRVVKVELIVKDDVKKIERPEKKEKVDISEETENKAEHNIKKFLDELISKLPTKDITYEIKKYYWGKLWIQLAIYAGRYERRGIKEIYPFTLPGKQAILIKAA